jgi:hypothetical protein
MISIIRVHAIVKRWILSSGLKIALQWSSLIQLSLSLVNLLLLWWSSNLRCLLQWHLVLLSWHSWSLIRVLLFTHSSIWIYWLRSYSLTLWTWSLSLDLLVVHLLLILIWTWSLLISMALLWLPSLLLMSWLCLILNSHLFSLERLLWLLEHLLHLSFCIKDSVFQVCGFAT